ncbi:MAG: hypothetical protein DI603_22340 [Roseateles depolymerans]|uniref:PglD N-terminal domain-containing protein n=1 Tax=Roseateles depolymerans TaxID=76731 RepID=A0A2W5FCH2_9BURK|nr:MAG: hypothetical protein DI603_22340 [Roseateles depolymerans]
MNRKLFVIGTGGFAKEVAQLAATIQAANATWSSIEYLCESPNDISISMPFGSVVGTDKLLESLDTDADFVIGIGNPSVRRKIAARLSANIRLHAPNLIHPRADIDVTQVRLGVGNIITSGTVFTCAIEIGDHNVFNLNSTVGHDCHIGSFNVINPGCCLSGHTTLGDACLLGTGCQVLEGLSIASNSTVGGGALVAKSIKDAGTYVGVPAKLLASK